MTKVGFMSLGCPKNLVDSEVMLGHLRYGTHAGSGSALCHPYLRRHSVASRNLALAGNFNLTNARELFDRLVGYGIDPLGEADTGVVLEKIGHFLDREHEFLASTMGPGTFRNLDGRELARAVSEGLDLARVLRRASQDFDGGYVLGGMLGNGDAFVLSLVCQHRAGNDIANRPDT